MIRFLTKLVKDNFNNKISDIVYLDHLNGNNLNLYTLQFMTQYGIPYSVIIFYNDKGLYIPGVGIESSFESIPSCITKLDSTKDFIKTRKEVESILSEVDSMFEYIKLSNISNIKNIFGENIVAVDSSGNSIYINLNGSVCTIKLFESTYLESNKYFNYIEILNKICGKGVSIIWI